MCWRITRMRTRPELHKLIIRNIIDVQVQDVGRDERGVDFKSKNRKARTTSVNNPVS